MDIGAALWATAIQSMSAGVWITKTAHIGCRWGYSSLVWEPDSVMFPQARATGLTVEDWQQPDHGQPVRPAVLERGRQLARVLRRRAGQSRRHREAQRRRPDLGDLRRQRGEARELEAGAAARRSGRLFLQRRHHSGARGQDQESLPAASDVGRRAPGDGQPLQRASSPAAATPTSTSRRRSTRSTSRRTTRPGRRRSCTTR